MANTGAVIDTMDSANAHQGGQVLIASHHNVIPWRTETAGGHGKRASLASARMGGEESIVTFVRTIMLVSGFLSRGAYHLRVMDHMLRT